MQRPQRLPPKRLPSSKKTTPGGTKLADVTLRVHGVRGAHLPHPGCKLCLPPNDVLFRLPVHTVVQRTMPIETGLAKSAFHHLWHERGV